LVDCLLLSFVWVVFTCALICLVLLMDGFPSLTFIYKIFFLFRVSHLHLTLLAHGCRLLCFHCACGGGACWTRVIMKVWHPIGYWFLETRMDKPHCLIHSWWLDQHKASKRNEWPVANGWRHIQLCGLTFFQVGISFVLFLKRNLNWLHLGDVFSLRLMSIKGG
jgi:hypothetical protein